MVGVMFNMLILSVVDCGFEPLSSQMIDYSGLYNVTKTLAFASYFCNMRVKIMY